MPGEGGNLKFDKFKISFIVCLVVALVLAVALSISIYFNVTQDDHTGVCLTPQCINTASLLIDSIDLTADPCHDFYQFSCGNWKKKYQANPEVGKLDWFIKSTDWMKRQTLDFLLQNDSNSEPFPVHQARSFYRSCNHARGSKTIEQDVGWGLLETLNLCNESWLISMARAKTYFSLETLIEVELLRSTDGTPNILIQPGTFPLLYHSLSREYQEGEGTSINDEIQTPPNKEGQPTNKKDYISHLYKYFPNSFCDKNEDDFPQLAEDVIFFLNNVSQLGFGKGEPVKLHLLELQNKLDVVTTSGKSKIDWITYFNSLYEDEQIFSVNENTLINVEEIEFFESLSKYIETVDEEVLKASLWYEVLNFILPHASSKLDKLKLDIFSWPDDDMKWPDICVKTTNQYLPFASVYFLTQYEDYHTEIMGMFERIKEEYMTILNAANWLDEKTKLKVLEKTNEVKIVLGFPPFLKNRENLDRMYSNMVIDEFNYLGNIPAALKMYNTAKVVWKDPEYLDDQITVNAYYLPTRNAILVPAGLLLFPYYNSGSVAFDYGNLGSTLGHELAHGLDDSGVYFNKEGIRKFWWSASSYKEYVKRTTCFVEQYDNFHDETVNETCGGCSLGENTGDLVGVHVAYEAYKKYIQEKNLGEGIPLPALTQFNQDQIFFLAYGNFWCSDLYDGKERNIGIKSNEHASNRARTILPLANLPQFADVWNCPLGSTMNPEKKCRLWMDND